MDNKVILFDLDGTLTESGEGITKSVQYALEQMGKPEKDLSKLQVFIGPPLIQQFMKYAGFSKEEAVQALHHYRQRFATKGLFENWLYPGVEEMLQELSNKGYILAIASSKPEFYILQILEHFQMSTYFKEVVGATMDEKRTAKDEVIAEALQRLSIVNKENVVMVGDKEHDIFGAKTHQIPCIAVTYGYGTKEEIENAGPDQIVHSVQELKEYLL